MQFGMDQDLPGYVARVNGSWQIAWSNYNRAIGDSISYIPAPLFESDVTTRYLKWWRKFISADGMAMAYLEGMRMSSGSRREEIVALSGRKSEGILGPKGKEMEGILKIRLEDNDLPPLPPPPGFSPKSNSNIIIEGVLSIKNRDTTRKLFWGESSGISLTSKGAYRQSTLPSGNDDETEAVSYGHGSSERLTGKAIESSLGNNSDKNSHVPPPPGFNPNHSRMEPRQSAIMNRETGAQLPEGEHDECNQHQKESVETELTNKSSEAKVAAPDNSSEENEKSCKQTNHEAPWQGLEERICVIEKLCSWLKEWHQQFGGTSNSP